MMRSPKDSFPASVPEARQPRSCKTRPDYLAERNHQGLDNRLIQPDDNVGRATGEIACLSAALAPKSG
jgi:hypothetical protein